MVGRILFPAGRIIFEVVLMSVGQVIIFGCWSWWLVVEILLVVELYLGVDVSGG